MEFHLLAHAHAHNEFQITIGSKRSGNQQTYGINFIFTTKKSIPLQRKSTGSRKFIIVQAGASDAKNNRKIAFLPKWVSDTIYLVDWTQLKPTENGNKRLLILCEPDFDNYN